MNPVYLLGGPKHGMIVCDQSDQLRPTWEVAIQPDRPVEYSDLTDVTTSYRTYTYRLEHYSLRNGRHYVRHYQGEDITGDQAIPLLVHLMEVETSVEASAKASQTLKTLSGLYLNHQPELLLALDYLEEAGDEVVAKVLRDIFKQLKGTGAGKRPQQ